jgi:hypothetical protein
MAGGAALRLGCILVPAGFCLLTFGALSGSLALILAGTAITSAASYGFTYLGGLAEIASRAGNDRARASAGYFVYAYVGFSMPVIASGWLADAAGLPLAMALYVGALALASAALVMTLQTQGR